MDRKALFMFRIVYFKPNGKFYTEASVSWEVRSLEGDETTYITPNMNDAVAKLKGLRDSGAELPGLSTTGWDGPILIDCPDGFPCLILPDDK